MQTTKGNFHPTRFQDVAVTVDFHCNSACRFCIVQEGMNRFKGVPFDRFRSLVDENLRSKKYGRVVFTGGEVTLEKSLFSFIRYARESGGFEHIRLQTNGRRLADAEYARAIIAEGVNEFFISIHGDTAEVHDHITQRPGSFDELIRGFENLAEHGVRIITNSVMNTLNLRSLPGIVAIASRHGIRRMEFWNYLPMEDHEDERNLIAPMQELIPMLHLALDACKDHGIAAITKYVPRCLLREHGGTLDNGQPDVIIVESFWDTFPRFSCVYEAVCEFSEACLGLHHPYVNKFGWEEERLGPMPRTSPWIEKEEVIEGKPEEYGDRTGQGERSSPHAHPAWEALVEGEGGSGQVELLRLQLTRNQARYLFRLSPTAVAAGAGASASTVSEHPTVEVILSARDDNAPALARSKSFNIFYGKIEGPYDKQALAAWLRMIADRITARDGGQLSLDSRKGLLQVLPPNDGRPRPKPRLAARRS